MLFNVFLDTIFLLYFTVCSEAQNIQCHSIPGKPRPGPITSIPDCVRVLNRMAHDPRLEAHHAWISGGFRLWGTSLLPVDWSYGSCRISLAQHEPGTPVRDTFPLKDVFPEAVKVMSYCMLSSNRDEGFVQVGPRQVVELHVATGYLLSAERNMTAPDRTNATLDIDNMS